MAPRDRSWPGESLDELRSTSRDHGGPDGRLVGERRARRVRSRTGAGHLHQATQRTVTLQAAGGTPSIAYTTNTSAQAQFIGAIASTEGTVWNWHTGSDAGTDDTLVVSYTATGSGTLPGVSAITATGLNGSVLSIGTVTRTLPSSTAAAELARATVAALALPSGVGLTEAGGTITLTVDLEEDWIAP